MTWRLAKSLEALRAQVNALAPNRSKASDGTIGDAAHSSRSSDHNPWVEDGGTGVVTALDVTHDPANGVDIQKLADALVASKDSRIKYIICNGRIVSGSGQKQAAWKWRPYSGANKHTKHVHVSVKASKAAYDDTSAWHIGGAPSVVEKVEPKQSVLKKGSKGPFVAELQANLAALGYAVGEADGVFGARTEAAVKAFQKARGLAVDGWAGPRTIDAIGKALAEKAAKPKIAKAEKTVPPAATDAVKQKASWWQKVTGFFGGAGGISALLYDWRVAAVIAVGAIVIIVLIVVFKGRIIAAFREINAEVR